MTLVARARSTDRRYFGVAEGIVTDVNDPGKEGRIKVKFPWFDEKMETEWCRVAQIYAGKGYGAFFVPEVDDEVLVAFVHGDMRLPIVLGGLYNGQDKPPTHRDQSNDRKLIRTKAGHEVTLDDTPGSEKITIVDKSGDNRVVIDTVGNAITISCGKGKLTLTGNEVEITSQAGMKISATGTLDVKGSQINLN
jgi:phage baseplate assembly protein V